MSDSWLDHGTIIVGVLFVGTLVILSGTAIGRPTSVGGRRARAVDQPLNFTVIQNGACYDVTPLGDGSTTVEEFFDYSTPEYSSLGTTALQENQVSTLFLYRGSEGVSLGLIHDEYGNGPGGSTITMRLGLPENGSWAVEDDDYPGRDDNWDHDGTRSEIDWVWAPGRSDGGALRGLGTPADLWITISPGFNDHADRWDDWPYSGNETHAIDEWRLVTGPGTTTELDMYRPVTVARGSCGQSRPQTTATQPPTTTPSPTAAPIVSPSTTSPSPASATPIVRNSRESDLSTANRTPAVEATTTVSHPSPDVNSHTTAGDPFSVVGGRFGFVALLALLSATAIVATVGLLAHREPK